MTPVEGDSERFYDDEVRHVAAHITELFPDGLTIGVFNSAISMYLSGLDSDQKRAAKERIYAELPDRLRVAILEDVLTRSAPAGEPFPQGETQCRICREVFEPFLYVDENGICPECWDLPEPRGAVQIIDLGTQAQQRSSDSSGIGRQSEQAEGGAS